MLRLLIAALLFFITIPLVHAQYTISGTIIDQETSIPLAFVSLVFNGNAHLGTTTDIDGTFYFEHSKPLDSIRLSYVGYTSQTIVPAPSHQDLILRLQKTDFALNEVVVVAGENPAYRIIRKVARQRQRHNPERIASYQCDSYQKILVYGKNNAPKKLDNQTKVDSLPIKKGSDFYFGMIEVISTIKQKAPDLYNEYILATKMTGVQQPNFISTICEIQPINFHRENFFLLAREYLNPITHGSIYWYEFRLEDTLYQGVDTIYKISFFPRKGRSFDGLKGVLLINTNGYAIQTVRAQPANTPKISLRIEQQYAFVDNKYWFPQQLNFEVSLSPSKKDTFTVQGKRYLRNIDFDQQFRSKDFNFNRITLAPDAHQRDSSFWQGHRSAALDKREEKTYQFYKKLEKKIGFWFINVVINSLNELEDERFQLGDVSLNYTQLIESNLYEQFRLGLGLYSSYKWCPYVSAGGYFAYGFGDQSWKYGGSLTIRPNPLKDIGFQISYINDVLEPAAILQNTHNLSKRVLPAQSFIRRNMLSQMDRVEEVEISAYTRFAQHFKGRIFANWGHRQPLYDYFYESTNTEAPLHTFRLARVGIQFRFSYRERLVQMGSSSLSLINRYPTFYFSYTKSLKGFMDGQFDYHKLLLGMESRVFVKGIGRTSSLLQAGMVVGEAPYSMLFNGRGSYQKNRLFIIDNTFQTMAPNEFVNDQFIYAFVEHDFRNLLLQIGKFKPQLKLYQAIGFGWLNNPDAHHELPLQDMRKGYFESGVVLSDIIRIPLLNIGYFGLGAGVFVRYGPYMHTGRFLDNVVFKLDLNSSF